MGIYFGIIRKLVTLKPHCTCSECNCNCESGAFLIVNILSKLRQGPMQDDYVQMDLLSFQKPVFESQKVVACSVTNNLTKESHVQINAIHLVVS